MTASIFLFYSYHILLYRNNYHIKSKKNLFISLYFKHFKYHITYMVGIFVHHKLHSAFYYGLYQDINNIIGMVCVGI